MNCRWIGCDRCKRYVDAGYRWAYWMLEEPGVVRLGEAVDLPTLMAQSEFWNPPKESDSSWLLEMALPELRRFLDEHRDHPLRYVESEMIYDPSSPFADWKEVERG